MTSFKQANRNARAGQETLEGSGRVIARRMGIMSEAMTDPLHADHRELTRMSTEKLTALSASAGAFVEGAVDLGQTTYQLAEREARHQADLVQRLSQSRNLADAAVVQAQWNFDAWTRAWTNSQTLTSKMLSTQARALNPIHSTVVKNVRRLKA